jgi:hypothetical protein
MALPTIPANSISLSQVNVELGLSATATISMNDAAVRTLFGVGGSGTQISMSQGSGKSNITVSLSSVTSNEPFDATPPAGGEPSMAQLFFTSNGTWNATLEASASKSGNWGTPTTAGAGSGFWIRFTRTFFSGGAGNSATGSTGWLQLNVSRDILVERTSGFGVTTAEYTIEIATDSGGSNIVASADFITLTASMT